MSKRKVQGTQADGDVRPISDEMVATSDDSETSTASESSKRRKTNDYRSTPPRPKNSSKRHETQHPNDERQTNLDNDVMQSISSIQNTVKPPKGYALEQFTKAGSHAITSPVTGSNSQNQRNKQTWLIQAPRGLSFESTSTLHASKPEGERFTLTIDGVEYALNVQRNPHQTTSAALLDGREGIDSAVTLATVDNKAALVKSMRQDFTHNHTEVVEERSSAHKQPHGLRVRYTPFGVRT